MSREARSTRVVLVAQRRLIGQTITAALSSRGLMPILMSWPPRGAFRHFRERVGRSQASVGVVLCDLSTPDLLRDVEVIVGIETLRWIVLTDSDIGPRWGT